MRHGALLYHGDCVGIEATAKCANLRRVSDTYCEFVSTSVDDHHLDARAKMRFLLDIDVITVYAIPTQGRGPDGKTVNGLAFETHHSGTYPLGGIPKSKAVFKRVVEGADRVADAIPRVN